MKSRVYGVIALSLLCVVGSFNAAFAGSVKFDFRGDATSQSVNQEALDAGAGRDHYRFLLQTARIDFRGDLTEKTYIRSRIRANDTAASRNQRDFATNMLELAYVSMKASENIRLSFGKVATEIGGNEGQTSTADLYLTSLVHQSTSAERYGTGAKMTADFEKGSLVLLSVNQPSDAPSGATASTFEQNRTMWAALLKGKFSPLFQPQIGTYVAPRQNGNLDRQDQYLNVGLKSELDQWAVEYDYLNAEYIDRTITKITDTLETHLLNVSYKWGQWTPRVKLDWTKEHLAQSATVRDGQVFRHDGYQFALEYQPVENKNYRYHLAYLYREKRPEATKTQVVQTALIGVRINADFL